MLINLILLASGIFFILLGLVVVAQLRAVKRGVVGYKDGMYLDTKTGRIVGTKTPVYRDPKTGVSFFGKTERSN